jgi:hypothetical protein
VIAYHPDSAFGADCMVVVRAGEAGAFDEPTRAFHAALAFARGAGPVFGPVGDKTTGELKQTWRRELWEIAAGLLGCDLLHAKAVVDYCVSRGHLALWPAR